MKLDGETYHNSGENLRKNYDLLREPFPVSDDMPWQPKVYRYSDRKVELLAPYARKYIARDGAMIWAVQLDSRLNEPWGRPGRAALKGRRNCYAIK